MLNNMFENLIKFENYIKNKILLQQFINIK